MDERVARAYESVAVALRRLRPRLRLAGYTIELGAKRVHVIGGSPGMWRDLFDSLEHSDAVRADAHLDDLRERPTTVSGWRRRDRRQRKMRKVVKINLPRGTLDE